MSFLAELYRSKAGSSERQFGEDNNVALASFWETALKSLGIRQPKHHRNFALTGTES